MYKHCMKTACSKPNYHKSCGLNLWCALHDFHWHTLDNRDTDCPGLIVCLPSNIAATSILDSWSNVFSSNNASKAIPVFHRKIKWMSPRNMFSCPTWIIFSNILFLWFLIFFDLLQPAKFLHVFISSFLGLFYFMVMSLMWFLYINTFNTFILMF